MMTSAFFRTLSFSAEKNWAQNSGAKRREDISSLIMTISCYVGRAIPGVVWKSRANKVKRWRIAQKLCQSRKVVAGNGCLENLYGKLSGHRRVESGG